MIFSCDKYGKTQRTTFHNVNKVDETNIQNRIKLLSTKAF